MEINHFFPKGAFFKRTIHQLFIYILIIILMSNLSALVDVFQYRLIITINSTLLKSNGNVVRKADDA